jgi:hypothetical protein
MTDNLSTNVKCLVWALKKKKRKNYNYPLICGGQKRPKESSLFDIRKYFKIASYVLMWLQNCTLDVYRARSVHV